VCGVFTKKISPGEAPEAAHDAHRAQVMPQGCSPRFVVRLTLEAFDAAAQS
jgi:hypothetical protein